MKLHNAVRKFLLACFGLSMSTSVLAGVPVIDMPNEASLMEQTKNTMAQLVQLTQLIKSTTAVASALMSGKIPSLDQLEDILGDELLQEYLPMFGIDADALSGFLGGTDWRELKELAKQGQELYKEGEKLYKTGEGIWKDVNGMIKKGKGLANQFRHMNAKSAVSLGTKVIKNNLFAKSADDLNPARLAELVSNRDEAVKEAVAAGYSLALTAQQESASMPQDKLSSNSKGSNKADSVVTQIRNNTGALMSIATQLNMGNLLSASNLEVLASTAISSLPVSYLSPQSSSDNDSKKEDDPKQKTAPKTK